MALTGGWSTYTCKISAEENALLQKAVGIGVSYSPVAVATQVVAGTNYRFFCNAKVVRPDAPNEAKLVQFYVPLNSDQPEQVVIRDVPQG